IGSEPASVDQDDAEGEEHVEEVAGPAAAQAGSEDHGGEGWRMVLASLRPQWKGILVGVSAGLIWTLAKVSVPKLVQGAIDNAITPGDYAALWRWTAAIALAAVIAAIFTGIRRYSAFRESRLVEARLRDRVFAHVQRLHFAYHDRMP